MNDLNFKKTKKFGNGSEKKGAPFFNTNAHEDDFHRLKKSEQLIVQYQPNLAQSIICLGFIPFFSKGQYFFPQIFQNLLLS